MTEAEEIYYQAREEHAFRLRARGETWREIGRRMDITPPRVAALAHRYARRMGLGSAHTTIILKTYNWKGVIEDILEGKLL